jgi:hypothetical protein
VYPYIVPPQNQHISRLDLPRGSSGQTISSKVLVALLPVAALVMLDTPQLVRSPTKDRRRMYLSYKTNSHGFIDTGFSSNTRY